MNEVEVIEDFVVIKALEDGVSIIGMTRGKDTRFHHTEKLDSGEVMLAQFTENTSAIKVRGRATILTTVWVGGIPASPKSRITGGCVKTMWMVITLARSQDTAQRIEKILVDEGILVKLNAVYKKVDAQKNYYEVLVLEAEFDEAREILVENGL